MRKDWTYHLLACMGITVLIGWLISLIWSSLWVLAIAWGVSVLAGVGKELYDAEFDKVDLLFDIVGASFGIPILIVISML